MLHLPSIAYYRAQRIRVSSEANRDDIVTPLEGLESGQDFLELFAILEGKLESPSNVFRELLINVVLFKVPGDGCQILINFHHGGLIIFEPFAFLYSGCQLHQNVPLLVVNLLALFLVLREGINSDR